MANRAGGGAIQPDWAKNVVTAFHRLTNSADAQSALAPRRGLQAKAGGLGARPARTFRVYGRIVVVRGDLAPAGRLSDFPYRMSEGCDAAFGPIVPPSPPGRLPTRRRYREKMGQPRARMKKGSISPTPRSTRGFPLEIHTVKILLMSALAAPLALGEPATAAGIESLAFDSKALPADVQIRGAIVAGARWRDRLGENLLIATQTGAIRSRGPGRGADADLCYDAEVTPITIGCAPAAWNCCRR